MIVSHANNHLLTLSEFASDKANYHLKMSSKTLWAKSLHHDSRLYYCGYVTTCIHTHKCWQTRTSAALCAASELAAGISYECSDLMEGLTYCCIQLKLVFRQSDDASALFSGLLMLWLFEGISATLYTCRKCGCWQGKLDRVTVTCWKVSRLKPTLLCYTIAPFPLQELDET